MQIFVDSELHQAFPLGNNSKMKQFLGTASEAGFPHRRCHGLWLASAILLAGCAQTQTAPTTSSAPVGPTTLNVADAAIAGGDPNMALSVSQSVLTTDAGNVDALVHEGDAYYALGRCPASEAAYQLALEHDAKSAAAETGLGRCLLKTDPVAAAAAFTLATRDDPGNAAAWNDLGIAFDLQGNFAAAVNPYQQALLADPSLTAAEVNLGLSLALSGNGPEALQYLGPLATGQGATPKIREDYAAALVASGRSDEARQVLAVDLPPDQVNSAMQGFSDLIAQSQQAPSPLPPAPTAAEVTTTTVTQSESMPAAAPVVLTSTTPPTPDAPPPAYVPDNSTGAYTGPSPIPVTASSSTPGPEIEPPAASPPPAAAPVSAPAHAVSAAPVPVAPVEAPSTSSGDASVQLGALNSQDDAERAWHNISSATPALFGDKQPDIVAVTVNSKTFYRLRVGGFDSKADAAKFCGEVSAAGNACTVANF
jgi:Flp pilus assembly protein TadD